MNLEWELQNAQKAYERGQRDLAEVYAWNVLRACVKKPKRSRDHAADTACNLLQDIYTDSDSTGSRGLIELGQFMLANPCTDRAIAYEILANGYGRLGMLDEAEESIRRLDALTGPSRTAALYAHLHSHRGNPEAALKAIETLCEPQTFSTYCNQHGRRGFQSNLLSLIGNFCAKKQFDLARRATALLDSALLELWSSGTGDRFSERYVLISGMAAVIDACEHRERHAEGVTRSTNGLYYIKIGNDRSVRREYDVIMALARKQEDANHRFLAMPTRFSPILHSEALPPTILAFYGGEPLETVLTRAQRTGNVDIHFPPSPYLVKGRTPEEHLTVRAYVDGNPVESLLEMTVRNLADIHAFLPAHLADPAITEQEAMASLEARLRAQGCPTEDAQVLVAGITPLQARLQYAIMGLVKDANPQNFGVFPAPGRTFDRMLIAAFDFGILKQATPHYDLIKLLEHDRHLSRQKADELTRKYVTDFNNAVPFAQGLGVEREPISDLGRFEFDRELWRPVQYLASYFHPKYASDAYAPNRAFWMERGAETVDILLAQHASRFGADERSAIAAMKPVFEKYRRIASERAKERP